VSVNYCYLSTVFTFNASIMSKRSVTEIQSAQADGQAYAKASGSGSKRPEAPIDEMGEFEDAWEDEIESDEDVVDAEAAGDGNGTL
jgi:ribosome assembly protein RRB1